MNSSIFQILLIVFIIYMVGKSTKDAKQKKGKGASASPAQARKEAAPVQNRVVQASARMSVPDPAPAPAMAPKVSVTKHDHSDMYAGSLGHDGFEGNPEAFDSMPSSHSEELFTQAPDRENTQARPALQLNFSPSSIANAFILQEILKRPKSCSRP